LLSTETHVIGFSLSAADGWVLDRLKAKSKVTENAYVFPYTGVLTDIVWIASLGALSSYWMGNHSKHSTKILTKELHGT